MRKLSFFKGIDQRLPEVLTGDRKNYERELYLIYGKKDLQPLIDQMKKDNAKRYLATALLLGILLLFCMGGSLLHSPHILNETKDGKVYIQRPNNNEGTRKAQVVVSGQIDGKEVREKVILSVKPQDADKKQEKMEQDANGEQDRQTVAVGNLNSAIQQINRSDENRVLYLPNKIDGMTGLTWKEPKSHPMVQVLILGAGLVLVIYFARYEKINALKKKCGESIEGELPDFISKLVLLMNAGLVLSSAFTKAVDDGSINKGNREVYFYKQLEEINHRVCNANASVTEELKRFAERSGNRDFMRVTNMMSDNIHKGTELVDILKNEGSFLWFQRKKRAEEKGRLAETKLTFPLAIQLLVLIMITLAPALLEM